MGKEHCEEHSGNCEAIGTLKENVSDLYNKWNTMQTILISTLATSLLSLAGIIITIIIQYT